ncbi:hypothetical protein ABH922_001242 [Rhodococcus sp. 27YEA15]|uniref:hypothetical protein n=1 Tax=Rhodococcus sp. 27YEA15 TaxID=3156259 RepID=UPI003C7B0747
MAGPAYRDLQSNVLELDSGAPAWTAIHEGSARAFSTERVTFRRVTDRGLQVQTWLAVRRRTALVDAVLDICASLSSADQYW